MILVGYLAQLSLVNDRAPYETKRLANLLWEEFKMVVTLSHVFWQDGQNQEQQIFCQSLTNIKDANPTIDNWMLLTCQDQIQESMHKRMKNLKAMFIYFQQMKMLTTITEKKCIHCQI